MIAYEPKRWLRLLFSWQGTVLPRVLPRVLGFGLFAVLVVLADAFRRLGLASAVYEVVEADAVAAGCLTLEVNAEPPNPASLAFHAGRGYAEVGRLGGPGKTVALMAKRLTP